MDTFQNYICLSVLPIDVMLHLFEYRYLYLLEIANHKVGINSSTEFYTVLLFSCLSSSHSETSNMCSHYQIPSVGAAYQLMLVEGKI